MRFSIKETDIKINLGSLFKSHTQNMTCFIWYLEDQLNTGALTVQLGIFQGMYMMSARLSLIRIRINRSKF